MARGLDELRAAVAETERRIDTLIRADDFVEDLIELTKRRKALLAEIRGVETSLERDADDGRLPWSRASVAPRH